MMHSELDNPVRLARYTGLALAATIVLGMATAFLISSGIDINLSADVEATARNMLEAEQRLRAKAYMAIPVFALELVVYIGWLLLLNRYGRLLAPVSGAASIAASIIMLFGAVFAMNAAQLASNEAFLSMANEPERLLLTGLQATSDYTSFHLALVLGSLAKAGFFFLFLRSGLIPVVLSAWGLFASLLVAFMIVTRDFVPALANDTLTMMFILANLIAMVATALYLSIKGVRTAS